MHALKEVRDFFNVGKNLSNTQITITAELIMSQYWYFKIEDIKLCLRRAMFKEKLFDRLDGNIILGWFMEYDAERTEETMRISDQHETQQANELTDNIDAVSFEDYVADLRNRAKKDEKAAELLKEIDNPSPKRLTMLTSAEREQRDHDFKMWRTFNYLLHKKQ